MALKSWGTNLGISVFSCPFMSAAWFAKGYTPLKSSKKVTPTAHISSDGMPPPVPDSISGDM